MNDVRMEFEELKSLGYPSAVLIYPPELGGWFINVADGINPSEKFTVTNTCYIPTDVSEPRRGEIIEESFHLIYSRFVIKTEEAFGIAQAAIYDIGEPTYLHFKSSRLMTGIFVEVPQNDGVEAKLIAENVHEFYFWIGPLWGMQV